MDAKKKLFVVKFKFEDDDKDVVIAVNDDVLCHIAHGHAVLHHEQIVGVSGVRGPVKIGKSGIVQFA